MFHYAILCGSAPEGFQQKKLVAMHDYLTSEAGGSVSERNIIIFPNGVPELLLESVLNGVFDSAAEEDSSEVLLYFCAMTEADLNAELSDSYVSGVEVVRLGNDEIRKDVIAYYAALAEKMGIGFQVRYESDCELVREEVLGYERIG